MAEFAFGGGDKVNLAALGQKAPELAAGPGSTVSPTRRCCWRRCRPTSTSSPRTRWCRRS